MPKGKPLSHLVPTLLESILDTMLETSPTGRVNARDVYRELIRLGYYNIFTGKPYTYQQVSNVIRASRSMKSKIFYERISVDHPDPLVVYNPLYPQVSEWLKDTHPGVEVVMWDKMDLDMAEDRLLFGYPTMACMYIAYGTYWPFKGQYPVVIDAYGDDTWKLRRLQVNSYYPSGPRVRKENS